MEKLGNALENIPKHAQTLLIVFVWQHMVQFSSNYSLIYRKRRKRTKILNNCFVKHTTCTRDTCTSKLNSNITNWYNWQKFLMWIFIKVYLTLIIKHVNHCPFISVEPPFCSLSTSLQTFLTYFLSNIFGPLLSIYEQPHQLQSWHCKEITCNINPGVSSISLAPFLTPSLCCNGYEGDREEWHSLVAVIC